MFINKFIRQARTLFRFGKTYDSTILQNSNEVTRTNVPVLHPLKTQEKQRLSGVFRGIKSVQWPEMD